MKNRFLLLMVALGLLVSCNNILDRDGDGVKNSSDGGTYLVIGTASMERTLYPVPPAPYESFQDMLTELKLEGVRTSSDGKTVDEKITLAPTADSGLTSLEKFSDLVGKPIPIQTGSWDFTLTAKLDNVEFSGTVTKEIIAGETNTISFNLAASGAGGINITLQFTNTNVTKVVAELRTAGSVSETPFESKVFSGSEQIKDATIKLGDGLSIEGHEVSFVHDVLSETPLPSGSYLLNFDFYDDDFKLNSIPYIVRVADGLSTDYTQKIELNDTYTVDYLEIVDNVETNVNEDEFVDSIVTKKYSRKMEFSLPQMKREGKIFGGWYTDLSNKDSAISEVKKGTTANLKLYAKWYSPELYVSAKGSSENNGYEEGSALDSIATAVSKIESLTADVGVVDWTIYVSGEIVGTYTLGLQDSVAKKLTISGTHENSGNNYIDILDGGSVFTENQVDATIKDSVFIVYSYCVPVVIENLKITHGNNSNGYGGAINNSGNVTLGKGAWLTDNHTYYDGGAVMNGGTFIMETGSRITNNSASDSGGAVRNGGTFIIRGGEISGNSAGGSIIQHDGEALIISGSPSIGTDQIVCLASYFPFTPYDVTVGELGADVSPIPLKPGSYTNYNDLVILKMTDDSTLTSDIISKFALVQPESGSVKYEINLDGKLVQKTASGTGSVTTDNRALNIAINTNTLYRNTALRFSATDAAGNKVSDGVTYSAEILYKGREVNTLGGETYYSVSGNVLTLSSTNPLPKEGAYQLYVTASQVLNGSDKTPVTSSQTFDVEFVNEIVTPDTQVALYDYDSDNDNCYSYYLVDSSDVQTAELKNPVLETSTIKPTFDMYGNFYCLDSDATLKSNNPKIGTTGVKLTQLSGVTRYAHNFIVDLANNNAYAWGTMYSTYFNLYKYPSLLTSGTTSDAQTFKINTTNFSLKNVVVYDNILYAIGTDNNDEYDTKIRAYDISVLNTETTEISSASSEYNLSTYLGTLNFANWDISDVYALEGVVYLLVKDCSYTSKSEVWNSAGGNIYNRGAVVKYVAPLNGKTENARYLGLKETVAFANTDIPKMQLYYSGPLYSAGSYDSPILTIDGSEKVSSSSTTTFNYYFPNVYALSIADVTEKNYFASPAKVIAIKPKKLVIADDGIAFYADSDGFAYMNINRVVTINLEDFVIESVQTTKANFDSNITGYLRSDSAVSLGNIASANGSYYSDDVLGYYYNGSAASFEGYPVNNLGGVVFAIKNGDKN